MTDLQTPPPADTPSFSSRRGLLVGAGVLASAAGLGLSWNRTSTQDGGSSQTEPFPGFWAQQWDTPQGDTLRAQDFRGKPLLINFWATWCPPCVDELPLINAFFQQHQAKGWQVIGLAVDRVAAVQSFLQKMPLAFPVGMVGADGGGLGKQLGNPSGALPFSVVVARQGNVAQRKLGRLHAADLESWAQLK
jgi:thiol-disulfide isomerase/thioredoxin